MSNSKENRQNTWENTLIFYTHKKMSFMLTYNMLKLLFLNEIMDVI